MPIPALKELISDDMRQVDDLIRRRLHSDVALIRQVSEYIVGGGGKRLRPALVLLSANAFGFHGPERLDLAAIVEFIHTATLLHDDVVDESRLRRGQPTANALFGNAASVLVGDFLYSRAFQMMVGINSMRVMEVLAEATNTIAEGEVMQLLNCHDPEIDEDRYLRVIRCKTAKLFEAAGRLGAILGGGDAEAEDAMARYGMHLGTAFQLIDDVLDYSGDSAQTGKNIGDDLAEGKATLPLIHAMRRGDDGQAAVIRHAIETGGLGDLDSVLRTIQETGALAYAREQADRERAAACEALGVLPHSKSRDCLVDLATFSVTRDH